MTIMTRGKGALKELAQRLGYEIGRAAPPAAVAASRSGYEISPSCQVRDLDSLYGRFFRSMTGWAVEVGAYDGISHSNVSGLIEAGWSAVLVEPIPAFAEACRARHHGNPAVVVEQIAATARPRQVTLRMAGSLTTSRPQLVSEYEGLDWARNHITSRDITVAGMPLDELLDRNDVPHEFDVLSVDVEGAEADVFAGFDLQRWRPKMMIVELANFHPDLISSREEHQLLQDRLERAGYTIAYKDTINTVFVRRDLVVDPSGSNT